MEVLPESLVADVVEVGVLLVIVVIVVVLLFDKAIEVRVVFVAEVGCVVEVPTDTAGESEVARRTAEVVSGVA